jgi:hypothetical protein
MVIFPWIQMLRRALNRSAAAELGARFLPMERNYPALARWIGRIEALPGYERTYPPHWREAPTSATLPSSATQSTPVTPVAPET